QLRQASIYLAILAGFTFFGLIHSALPEGSMYLPWTLPASLQVVPYQFTIGYILLSLMFFAFSFTKESKAPYVED
ncbi:MAG: hypothetical protein HYV28_20035, partial [Ignavibacteriales bacterium]|nr:hypothetical protein [Ignavibacteriales bacterium]